MRRRLITVLVVLLVSWGGLAVTLAFGVTPRLGLDLQGGTSVILTAPEGTDPEVVDVAVEIMRSRIEDFGIQEPEISVTSDRTVLVQLPGVTNPERALDAIGQTGELSFRPVAEVFGADQNPFAPPTTTTTRLHRDRPPPDRGRRNGLGATHLGPRATSTTAPDVTSTTAASLGVPAGLQATTTTAPADDHHNQRRAYDHHCHHTDDHPRRGRPRYRAHHRRRPRSRGLAPSDRSRGGQRGGLPRGAGRAARL